MLRQTRIISNSTSGFRFVPRSASSFTKLRAPLFRPFIAPHFRDLTRPASVPLQQLKDKVMAHLEMLIAKGEIRGPPYVMSDDQEFPFLRKFIERQMANVPHNPRLRGLSPGNDHQPQLSVGIHRSETPEDSRASTSFVEDPSRLLGPFHSSLLPTDGTERRSSRLPDEDHNGSSSTMNSQPGSRSRIATWDKDAAVNSTVPHPFSRPFF